MFQYYELITKNYSNLWSQLLTLLTTNYSCVSLSAHAQGSLVLRMVFNTVKLVRFQVDSVNGTLQADLQKLLVSRDILKCLDLAELVISVDAKIT